MRDLSFSTDEEENRTHTLQSSSDEQETRSINDLLEFQETIHSPYNLGSGTK